MEPLTTETDRQILIDTITGFINDIGIECVSGTLPDSTFLPGIDIQQGKIIYDINKMSYPGDLLHESGHLAVLLPSDRATASSPDNMNGNVAPPAAEVSAIAWSWAALKHLNIDPAIVFHPAGYKGGSENLIENYSEGKYMAVSFLQYLGMTEEPKRDIPAGEYTYPKMKHWLRLQETSHE